MMTPQQIRLLAIARRQVERLSAGTFDEGSYRLLLRNVGGAKPDAQGHISGKALSQAGFEDVMAALEAMGFRDDKDDHHWRDIVARRQRFASSRQVYEIRRRAPDVDYPLAALVRRFSLGRTDQVERLNPREAYSLIEMLKDASARPTAGGCDE